MKRKTPAQTVIDKFGGCQALGDAIDRDRSRIWRWTQPKAKGGTDGRIPSSAIPLLFEAARERDIPLSADDLYLGAEDA